MQTFIDELVQLTKEKYPELSELTVILPSKRACLYFKRGLIDTGLKNTWLPEIITLTEFIKKYYPGKIVDNLTLISELYKTAKELNLSNIESFEQFYSWGNTLLADFNRVDAYMIDSTDLYKNLRAIEELDRWSFNSEELSEKQIDFNDFWMQQGRIYLEYKKQLEHINLAYAGMATRNVAENAETYFNELKGKSFLVAGLNAISKAEQIIIDQLSKIGQLYYKPDIDQFFIDDYREAGHFYRQLIKKYSWDGLSAISDTFDKNKKDIDFIGAAQNSTMAQVVGQILAQKKEFTNTAVVLANENLLEPILQNIPKNITALNVTMGYKLKQTPVYDLFLALAAIQNRISKNGETIYYKDLIRFLNHPYLIKLLGVSIIQNVKKIINKDNLVFCKASYLESIFQKSNNRFNFEEFLFKKWNNFPVDPTIQITKLIDLLLNVFDDDENALEVEYLFQFRKAILQMQNHLDEYQIEMDLKGYKMLFTELLRSFTINFKGEPLVGLQIMGLLETRALDFEDVIIVSANEGTLPKGRSTHSFIPRDLQFYFELPGIKEQDALFAYYFYRLISRAKKVSMLYTTNMGKDIKETEPSRYIRQLQYYTKHNELPFNLKYEQAKPDIRTENTKKKNFTKDVYYRTKLKAKLARGISPTALSTFLNCPLDFYNKYILKLGESKEVDEEIGADVFGNVIHETLDRLYQPFIDKTLDKEAFESITNNLDIVLDTVIKEKLKNRYIKTGVNQLNIQIIKKLLEMFIAKDKEKAKEFEMEGKNYKILALEKELEREYVFDINGEAVKVKLRGLADRIDKVGNTIRLIDYKTGKVDGITADYMADVFEKPTKQKALQLLLYRAMYDDFELPDVITGIFGFKSVSRYLRILNLKKVKNEEMKEAFSEGLENLVKRMFDDDEPIEHNPKSKWCKFCEYNLN
jgi:RecB family exonuclease